MEAIKQKTTKLLLEHETLTQNLSNSVSIVSNITEYLNNVRLDDATIQTNFDSTQFYQSVNQMLDTFTELFQKFNTEIYGSYQTLKVAGNGYNLKNFSHPVSDIDAYKENDVGKCVISNVENVAHQHCHIIDAKKPLLNLYECRGAKYNTLPQPREVFAVDLGSGEMLRAVRNNFICGEPQTIALCLIDTGEIVDIPFNCDNMYALPQEIRSIESRALHCKVVEIIDHDGRHLDVDHYLKKLLYERVGFQIVKIENGVLWIKISLKTSDIENVFLIESSNSNKEIRCNDSNSSSLNPFASEFIYPDSAKSSELNVEKELFSGHSNEFETVDDTTPLIDLDSSTNEFTSCSSCDTTCTKLLPAESVSTKGALMNAHPKLLHSDSDNESDNESSPTYSQSDTDNTKSLLNENKTQQNGRISKPNNVESTKTMVTKPPKSVNDLTPEQLEMLYEEPLNTSNALKAVMGYVPQDEKRICRFYDPVTKGCYKGSRCRFEHVPLIKDGWTRDRCVVQCDIRAEQILPKLDEYITIFPTFVVNVSEFYAQIPELNPRGSMTCTKLRETLNKKEKRARYRRYTKILGDLELVFVLYQDKFYRGKTIAVDEKEIKVFLVDFGPTIIVTQKYIYEWDNLWDFIPFQAYRCHLYNLKKIPGGSSEAIKELKEKILNKKMSAKVISSTDDLHLQLFDEDGFDVVEDLCVRGLAEYHNMVYPAPNQKYVPA